MASKKRLNALQKLQFMDTGHILERTHIQARMHERTQDPLPRKSTSLEYVSKCLAFYPGWLLPASGFSVAVEYFMSNRKHVTFRIAGS